jgi:hypothetical protein
MAKKPDVQTMFLGPNIIFPEIYGIDLQYTNPKFLSELNIRTPQCATNAGWRRETGKFEVDCEIPPRGQVPSAHEIRMWVRNFVETGSVLKKKSLVGVYCLYVSQKTLMLW